METSKNNTEEYLAKVQNTNLDIDPKILDASVARLNQPFENIVKNPDGSVEIKIGESELKIVYSPYFYNTGAISPQIVSQERRIISKLHLKTEEIDTDLITLLPKDSMVSEVDTNEVYGYVVHSSESRYVYINSRLESMHMLIILLHEIGHVIDEEKIKKMGVENSMDSHPNSDLASEIRKERMASAFVLRILRSILKDKAQMKDAVNLLKHDALRSYYKSVTEEIKNRSNGLSSGELDINAQDIADYIDQLEE